MLSFWKKCLIVSVSSVPFALLFASVILFRTEADPRDSWQIGTKTIPSSLHAASVCLHLLNALSALVMFAATCHVIFLPLVRSFTCWALSPEDPGAVPAWIDLTACMTWSDMNWSGGELGSSKQGMVLSHWGSSLSAATMAGQSCARPAEVRACAAFWYWPSSTNLVHLLALRSSWDSSCSWGCLFLALLLPGCC